MLWWQLLSMCATLHFYMLSFIVYEQYENEIKSQVLCVCVCVWNKRWKYDEEDDEKGVNWIEEMKEQKMPFGDIIISTFFLPSFRKQPQNNNNNDMCMAHHQNSHFYNTLHYEWTIIRIACGNSDERLFFKPKNFILMTWTSVPHNDDDNHFPSHYDDD